MTDEPTADAVAPPRPEVDGRPSPRELLVWGLLVAVMLVLVGLSLWRQLAPRPPSPLPLLGTVPAFALTDRDGATVGRDDFAGAPWIADFMFTRCVGVCPRMTAQMKRVEGALPADSPVRIASFSVDPEHDTPAVLAAYAERFGAGARWHFLTGERDALYTLIRDGFKLAVDPSPPAGVTPFGDPIVHSNRFVLLDAAHRIRGYYDSFDEAAIHELLRDLEALGAEP